MKTTPDLELPKLKRHATDGDAEAQFQLGKRYHLGLGVEVNFETALKWYRLSADQGNAKAKINLGVMYREGHGVPADAKIALKLWEDASKDGNVDATYALGVAHLQGHGTEKSEERAIEYLNEAAERGSNAANRKLGEIHHLRKDPKALMFFHSAAEAGDFQSQWNLGMCYLREDLGKRDFLNGRRFLMEATFTLERLVEKTASAHPENASPKSEISPDSEGSEEIRLAPEIAAVSTGLEGHASALVEAAEAGDHLALETLFSAGIIYSSALTQLCANHPGYVKRFAARKLCWPFVLSRGSGTVTEAGMIMDEIGLGSELPFDLKVVTKDGPPARSWCFALASLIETERQFLQQASGETSTSKFAERIRNLPDLSRESQNQWFEVCWDALLGRAGGHPEQIPELAAIGIDSTVLNAKPRARAAIIRDNVKTRLKQTFPAILKKTQASVSSLNSPIK